MNVDTINFDLQPKQFELLNLLDDPKIVNPGTGGPRGGGKSRGIRDIMLIRRLKYKTPGWLVRRTFGELWDNHIKKYFAERPYMRDWYNAQTRSFKCPGGGEIIGVYAEHEGDLLSHYGKEAQDIFIDQAEQFTEEEINFLRTCRRYPGVSDGDCKLLATINPGGKSHGYMKRVYIDKLYVENEIPSQFAFIEASGWDNVEWVRNALTEDGFDAGDFYGWDEQRRFEYFVTRSQYGRDLNALPETMRIQQLLGRWDYFEGQVFPELGRIHDLDSYFNTSDPIQWEDFHRELKKIGGLDHASTGVTAYGLSGIDVDENLFELDGYYQRNRLISEHAEAIKALKAHYSPTDYQVIDPSTEAKTIQNKHEMFSVQDAYRREGLSFVSAHRSSIAVGIDLIKELLKVNPMHRNPFTQALGSPRLFISRSRCPDLWREMTELQTINGEFVGSDHWVDVLRYKVMSRPRAQVRREKDLAKLPTEQQIVIRSHDKWAKDFDRSVNKNSGSYW